MPVVDIADPFCMLPETLILDTSILLAMTPRDRRYATVSSFLSRLRPRAKTGKLLCLVPLQVFIEAYHVLIRKHFEQLLPKHQARLKTKMKKKHIRWSDLYKDRPDLIKDCIVKLDFLNRTIQAIPARPVEPAELVISFTSAPRLVDRTLHFIEDGKMLSADASIVAVAERLGVNDIATLDKDFASVASRYRIYSIPTP